MPAGIVLHALAALSFGAAVLSTSFVRAADRLPMLHAQDDKLVNAAGKAVVLKGCNLGNYLMLEGWMFGGTLQQSGKGLRDGATFYRTLKHRFGDEQSQRLIDAYRQNWIQPRDFELIKSFGFNVVRLPFDYRLIQEDTPPYRNKADAFRWLDHAVDMAEAAGLYTILDLHGVPGGQSREDHTGESGQNKLWESDTFQQRTVEVWRTLAEHFKDRSAIAAYDLMNEPYGDHKQDVRPVLKSLMPQITQAIRNAGDSHVVYFPAPLWGGIDFYGDPHAENLSNVAFTEHFYPGLFGSKSCLETQAELLNQALPEKRNYTRQIRSPFLVGEFNVVLASEDSERLMRAYYDRFAEYGWQATMWSYKLLTAAGKADRNAWYLVTNARPLAKVDIDTSSFDELQAYIHSLATMPLVEQKVLHEALTTRSPEPLYLASNGQLQADRSLPPDGGQSLLRNGSFETAVASTVAGGWNAIGTAAQRDATGGRDGTPALSLDPSLAASGVWQDIPARPGGRYTFTVFARREPNANAGTRAIELKLESTTPRGQIVLNYDHFDLSKLPADGSWQRLTLHATAASDQVRAMILTGPKPGTGNSRVFVDDAAVTTDEPGQ